MNLSQMSELYIKFQKLEPTLTGFSRLKLVEVIKLHLLAGRVYV